MHDVPLLRTSVSFVDGCAVLELAGEIDLSSKDALEDAIGMAVRHSAHRVEIDLRNVSFCDSSGISAFLHGHALATRNGGRLVLRNAQPPVRTVLELTHVDVVLHVEP